MHFHSSGTLANTQYLFHFLITFVIEIQHNFNKIYVKPGIATEYPLENSFQNTKPCKL